MISLVGEELSIGKFLAFSAAFMTFLHATISASGAVLSLISAVPLYERTKPILDALPEPTEGKLQPGSIKGRIEFSHVYFRYKPGDPLVLHDLSLQVEPGEFVAIVGPSGSGKSTLTRLLLGFEKPESGTVLLDGLDLAGLDIQMVRRQFGVVLQGGKLMPGDIFRNIVGNSLLTLDDAWEAARLSGLEDDIREMPMGMHTVLGEGSSTLSGGQRQRLMIARAIVNRPRVLIFDEATSALDNRTQDIVSRSLENLKVTRLVIAHRLSTIQSANRIYVIEKGHLVQTGTFTQLRDSPGPFANMIKRQIT
jgi:ABC-type bacteriocin/lantibiotic exporter with double-glycine peptidase domain